MRSSNVDDPTWRLAWVLERTDARATEYPIDVYHPVRGWALKPGLRGVLVECRPLIPNGIRST